MRVSACGICGSDLHRFRNRDGIGEIPGHEVAGTIADAPAGSRDAVYVVDPWITCRHCDFCLAGQSEQCAEGRAIGLDVPGGLADFLDVPSQNLHAISPSLTELQASMAEPFGVCLRAVHLANLKIDSRVLVLGAGSLGLISGLLARDRAASVTLSTLHPHQAELAGSLGLNAVAADEAEDWAKIEQPDVVIEAVGGEAGTIEQAMNVCRPGGRIVVIGMFTAPVRFDAMKLVGKGLRIFGSRLYGRTERGSEMAAAAAVLPRFGGEISMLQTHQYRLSDLKAAFATALDPAKRPVKVTVIP